MEGEEKEHVRKAAKFLIVVLLSHRFQCFCASDHIPPAVMIIN